jgi:multiple sugar transport system substrate-binding protein
MRNFFLLIIALILVGCTAATPAEQTPTLEPSPVVATPTPLPTEIPEPTPAGPVTLTIWLPPEFDPLNGSPAGQVLKDRLEVFTKRRSTINIETRVKTVSGPGGIADTLKTAGAAAPAALPDLVLLPYNILETAATEGLLHPFDGLTTVMDDPDWYDFARQVSHVQNNTFGIPLTGDGLLLVYRPAGIETSPSDWATTATITQTLSFPAAASDSLVTLTLYQSLEGAILDEENHLVLEDDKLVEVLTFYQQGVRSELLSAKLSIFENDEQVWIDFTDEQSQLVITWASRYLQSPLVEATIAPLPTATGIPYTLATGWAWALTSPDPDRQILSAQLAEFLTISGFLGEWNQAAGYLPPRPSALALWTNIPLRTQLDPIAASAQLIPSPEVLSVLGPILQEATLAVLEGQITPTQATQAALEQLTSP